LNQINGAVVLPEGCPKDCRDCVEMLRIALLAGRIEARGLAVHLDRCGTRTKVGHYDSVTVTNPREPGRGTFHIGAGGAATWDYYVPDFDDDRVLDEIANVLTGNSPSSGTRKSRNWRGGSR
jgi:hypothetical protein